MNKEDTQVYLLKLYELRAEFAEDIPENVIQSLDELISAVENLLCEMNEANND